MADRLNFYFRQRVTEAELDLAFTQLEAADQALASDLGIFGIISGAVPRPHEPLADLTIDLTSPAKAYDRMGQRVFFGADQRVDCAVDEQGLPTSVMQAGFARWLGVFLRFRRQLSDPRTDGNGQQVFFRRDESFELRVRQGPEAPENAASRVALAEDELLVCDVRLRQGQTRIAAADIDLSRRQAFVFARADVVGVEIGLWKLLKPKAATVQASLDAVDDTLQQHVSARGFRHRAQDVDFTPAVGLRAGDVQGAVQELVTQLAAADTSPGSAKIGARALVGTPLAFPAGRVDDQLSRLHSALNDHLARSAAAHQASAIEAAPHGPVQSRSVQAQLQEILSLLASRQADQGAALIGNASMAGVPRGIVQSTVRAHLNQLLNYINDHARSDEHDARYYLRGTTVDDANKLQGKVATDFAPAIHDHNNTYLRKIHYQLVPLNAGEQVDVKTFTDRPDLVTLNYMPATASGTASNTTYFCGEHSAALHAWITRTSLTTGGSDYKLTVRNGSSIRLFAQVIVYHQD